jgi:hypothetical protein
MLRCEFVVLFARADICIVLRRLLAACQRCANLCARLRCQWRSVARLLRACGPAAVAFLVVAVIVRILALRHAERDSARSSPPESKALAGRLLVYKGLKSAQDNTCLLTALEHSEGAGALNARPITVDGMGDEYAGAHDG